MPSPRRFTRTPKQRELRRVYWQKTGFEFQDDTMRPFVEQFHANMKWYRLHAEEMAQQIEHHAMQIGEYR